MADKLTFELVAPERLVASEQVEMVTLPGEQGDFGVLPGHAPVLSILRPGLIVVQDEGRETRRIFVGGGFAEVTPQGLTVLAERPIDPLSIDRQRLDQDIRDAEEDVSDARDETARLAAERRLNELLALRAVL